MYKNTLFDVCYLQLGGDSWISYTNSIQFLISVSTDILTH